MLTAILARARVRLLAVGSVALLALSGAVLVGAVAAPAASAAGFVRAATVKGAAGSKLVRFVRPTGDTLIEKGTGSIAVIVQVRDGARLTKVEVDGVDVTGLLRAGPKGYYRGLLRSRHLHYGYNDAFARATGRNGRHASDHTRFIAAKRDDSLLRVTSFRTDTAAAPLQMGLREASAGNVRAALNVAEGVSARVYVNDRRVDRAFSRQGNGLVVRVGAAEGLRFGRNHVQILVHETHPYRHQSRFDIESRTVYISRRAPIASAGADHTITQDGLVELDGRAAKLPPGWTGRSFRWRIVSAPEGSRARLRNASGSRPTLVPGRPGRYEVRVSVRGTPARSGSGLRPMETGGQAGASNDTATLTVMPDIPPAGVRLDTTALSVTNRQIVLGGTPVPGTDKPLRTQNINYAVIDRKTLQIQTSGAVGADVGGIQQLGTIVDGYSGSLEDLVVLNWYSFGGDLEADRTALDTLLRKIGEPPLTAGQRQRVTNDENEDETGSAVGVAGAPAGSAFATFGDQLSAFAGRMSGSLRRNGVTGNYDFVFTDAVDFDTDAGQTPTDASPAQLTIKVGDRSYTQPNPGGGVSGFHLLLLDATTLVPLSSFGERVITTNAADGAELPARVQALTDLMGSDITKADRPLVILQSFGAPHGNDAAWDQAAKAIQRLGGTREVFDALNAADPRSLNGEKIDRKGSYAFVGRAGSTAPVAEASHSLDGRPGRLRGVLMRARDNGFEPMIAGTPRSDGESPVNTELVHVVNQAPQPFPAFKDTDGQPIDAASTRAVQNFLGGPDVTKLCSAGVPACDIRKTYYQNYRADWPSILDDLTNAKDECSQPHQGFTAGQCEGVRLQLREEVSNVAKVTQYFGPLGLQQPFGAAGVTALANVGEIAQQIRDAVQPPPTDNTTSNVLTGISTFLKFGSADPATAPVAAVLSTAFALIAYYTQENGAADLIGPPVTTAASKLGVELADRYSEAGDHLDDLGRLIVSDYGKLMTVASRVGAQPGPGETDWRLGNVGQARDALVRAAKETIYERLVPLVYPVMYDLGEIANARDWYCQSPLFYANKHLFADQPDGAQFVGRFPAALPWSPLIAVAAANATGHAGDARIPGIPASITDALFKPVVQGGLGLNKLQFYSPRNGFRWFPAEPVRSSKNVKTLHEFPYPENNPYNDPDQVVFCAEIPVPPGNSG